MNYYEWQRPTIIIFLQKIRRLQEVLPQTQATDNGRDGKRKCFVVQQDCIQFVWGVETPCNGLHASLLYFHYLSSPKIGCKTPETQWQILPRLKRSSNQVQKFLLHKHVTALSSSNRSPRPPKHMYPQLFLLSHYPLLELAVALLEAVEFSAGK